MELSVYINKNPLIREIFEFDNDIYLVGGYIRDIIAGAGQSSDIDFISMGNSHKAANSIAKKFNGRLVVLKDEQTFRVVLRDRKTLDFSNSYGTLKEDLGKRDFTINAIAWHPDIGIIDPYDGQLDISDGIIKHIKKANLINDPLRMLRAYRFMAQFGFVIHESTKKIIKNNNKLISYTPLERITLEFFKMINSNAPENAIYECIDDQLLGVIIPLNNKELRANLKVYSKVFEKLKKIININYIKDDVNGLKWNGLLCLECMTLGSEISCLKISLSRKIQKHLSIVANYYKEFLSIKNHENMFELFQKAGETTKDLLLITGNEKFTSEYFRFKKIMTSPILSAENIMRIAGIGEGRKLGAIINEMKLLEFKRIIYSKAQAKNYIKRHYYKLT